MTENYHRKLLPKIMSENYDLVYQSRRKVEIYRDTGVSKNQMVILIRGVYSVGAQGEYDPLLICHW